MNMTRKQRDIVDLFKLGVLGIVIAILVFYIVMPLYEKTRKNSFADEVRKCIRLSQDKYIADEVYGTSFENNDICINIKDVVNSNSDNYSGVVIFKKDSNSNINEYIYFSNGTYVYNSKESFNILDKNRIFDAKYIKPRFSSCDKYHKGMIF